jgi:DNA-binding transcriptional LysR family regulator
MLNVHQLKIFHSVARAGSFSRAAEELRITQPSVSIQVRELERALGAELFDQIGKRIFLTEAGKVLDEYAGRVLGLLEEAERAIRELRGLPGGSLRVGAGNTPGTFLLPPLLGALRQRFPDAEIVLDIAGTRRVYESILRNEIDVGVVDTGIRHEALVHFPYRSDEMVTIAAPGTALTQQGEVTAADVIRERLILRERGSGTREVVEQAFRSLGLVPTSAMEIPSNETIVNAVAAGLGVGILSRLAVEDAERTRRVQVVPVRDLRAVRTLWVVRHREKRLTPLLRALLEMLGDPHLVPAVHSDATHAGLP